MEEKDLRQAWGLVGSQQERIAALEQLVRDYAKWVAPIETTVKSGEYIPESWWEAKRVLQERAQKFEENKYGHTKDLPSS